MSVGSPIADLRCQPIVRPVVDDQGYVLDDQGRVTWRTVRFEALDPLGVGPDASDDEAYEKAYEHDLAVMTASGHLAVRWNLGVSVNIHPWCLQTPGFPQRAIEAFGACGLDHKRITLELLETGLIQPDDEDARINLAMLCGTGFNLGIDDMGSPGGHVARPRQVRKLLRDYQRPSWQLTLRTLKIDRSLVDRSRRRRLLAFLELAAGREVVIEGVESEDDFAYLLGLAPNALFQGYHFSRPLPPAAFEEYLKAENEAVLVTI